MPKIRLTDDQVDAALWPAARQLGYSADELKGMLAKKTAREVLAKLEQKQRSLNSRLEREDAAQWNKAHSAQRAEVFRQAQHVNLARLQDRRSTLSLPDRLFEALAEATLAQEGTRATSFETRISTGEKTPPTPQLDGTPLADQVREIMLAAVERAELEVDRVIRCLPPVDVNREVVKTTGHPTLVALRWGVSESQVRKLRTESGLKTLDGLPKVAA